jgi:putative Mg2+ transporter-C (MgtC) family protein
LIELEYFEGLHYMDVFRDGLFSLPEWNQFIRVGIRLLVAALLGGLLGFEREREGKAAGLRTHMLVSLGAALFTVASLEAGMMVSDLSRVFQGIATGVGFLGAGTILKLTGQQEIKGLTTAAGIWLTAAVGMAAGSGFLWIPILGVVIALIILSGLVYFERRL